MHIKNVRTFRRFWQTSRHPRYIFFVPFNQDSSSGHFMLKLSPVWTEMIVLVCFLWKVMPFPRTFLQTFSREVNLVDFRETWGMLWCRFFECRPDGPYFGGFFHPCVPYVTFLKWGHIIVADGWLLQYYHLYPSLRSLQSIMSSTDAEILVKPKRIESSEKKKNHNAAKRLKTKDKNTTIVSQIFRRSFIITFIPHAIKMVFAMSRFNLFLLPPLFRGGTHCYQTIQLINFPRPGTLKRAQRI